MKKDLGKLKGWTLRNKKIHKLFVLADFVSAIIFVNLVASLAERAKHHPDILIKYNKVKITLSTHDLGDVSKKDFSLAAKIDKIIDSN